MASSNDNDDIHFISIAGGGHAKGSGETPEFQEVDNPIQPTDNRSKNIILSSEEAWIKGAQGLQRNLIRALQEYQSGWSSWRESGVLAQKRQEMLKEVTE